MADYLPEFELPPEKPTEIPNEEEDPLVSDAGDGEGSITVDIQDNPDDERHPETWEQNPNFVYSDEEEIEEAEPVVVKTKKKLKNEEIFNTPKVVTIKEPEKPPKKKRQATEKQLAALKKAREKAAATRAEKARLKAEGKEVPKELALSKKKLKKVQEEQKVKEEKKETIQQEVRRTQVSFSQEQVAKITADAIDQYEAKRKVRKMEKAKVKEAQAQDARTRATLQRALGQQPQQQDVWSYALNGMI